MIFAAEFVIIPQQLGSSAPFSVGEKSVER